MTWFESSSDMTAENRNTSSITQQRSGPQVVDNASRRNDPEIPASDWYTFLDGFTRQHQGWLVNMTVTSGSKTLFKVSDSRLQNIAIVRDGESCRIRISVLEDEGCRVTHEILDPIRLVFKLDARGAHEGLDITAADHSVTAVRFRVAALPETLDGVLSEV
jgi:hypothetical protein